MRYRLLRDLPYARYRAQDVLEERHANILISTLKEFSDEPLPPDWFEPIPDEPKLPYPVVLNDESDLSQTIVVHFDNTEDSDRFVLWHRALYQYFSALRNWETCENTATSDSRYSAWIRFLETVR